MAQVILSLFFTLIEIFFINRVIMILMLYIQPRNIKRWILILTSIIDGIMLYVYSLQYLIVELTHAGLNYSGLDLFQIIGSAVIIIFMYVVTINKFFGGIHFKSRRQKEFERSMQGKEKSYLAPILISSIGLVAGIVSLIYYKVNYISDYKTDITISIVIIVAAALLLAITIYRIVADKKRNQGANVSPEYIAPKQPIIAKERTCVFIIEDEDNHYFYKTTYKGKVSLNELVGEIGDYYYISSYGVLKTGGEEYDLFGFKTSSFDHSLLVDIKMDRFNSKAVESILPYLEKNHSKIFNLDENNNPINSFDA